MIEELLKVIIKMFNDFLNRNIHVVYIRRRVKLLER